MAREDYPDEWLRQGDVNGDGIIGIKDILAITTAYKKPASEAPECDLDGDGWVSILDLERAGGNYGLTYEVWVKQVNERAKRAAIATAILSAIPIGFVSVGGMFERKRYSGY